TAIFCMPAMASARPASAWRCCRADRVRLRGICRHRRTIRGTISDRHRLPGFMMKATTQGCRQPLSQWVRGILLAGALASGATTALADAKIAGQPDNVRIDVDNSSVEEVLSALRSAFGLQYRSAVSLDRPLSGVYQGPLGRVLPRVLDGYDFVIKNAPDSVEVVGLKGQGAQAAAPPAPFGAVPVPAPAPVATAPQTAQTPAQPAAKPPSGEAQLEPLRRALEALRRERGLPFSRPRG